MTLSNKALLVTLNISQWTARKLDKRESAEVEARNGTAAGAARVNKSLLPMAKSLDDIHKLTGTIRTDYYKLTLPWTEGMGIIKADAYMNFTSVMAGHKTQWEGMVRKFVDQYPDLREDARHLLGSLYRDDDYPEPALIAGKFRMDLSFFPVPDAGDWRVSLGDAEVEELREQVAAKVMESQGRAMQEAWNRIHEVVERAHERLSDPYNIFRDSLIENARELCDLLPTLNIADDPKLERVRKEVKAKLCAHDPQDLREDEALRAEVSAGLDDIMKKMAGWR
jgi:hypothetical protein